MYNAPDPDLNVFRFTYFLFPLICFSFLDINSAYKCIYLFRYRTKFTPEQKERMKEFAERLGWRIQRHDDGALERFCVEIGVDRHVLKVWMHNHKHQMANAGGRGGDNEGMGVENVAMTGGASAGAAVEAAAIRV